MCAWVLLCILLDTCWTFPIRYLTLFIRYGALNLFNIFVYFHVKCHMNAPDLSTQWTKDVEMSCGEVKKTGPPLGLVNLAGIFPCKIMCKNFSEKKTYFCNAFSALNIVEIGFMSNFWSIYNDSVPKNTLKFYSIEWIARCLLTTGAHKDIRIFRASADVLASQSLGGSVNRMEMPMYLCLCHCAVHYILRLKLHWPQIQKQKQKQESKMNMKTTNGETNPCFDVCVSFISHMLNTFD